MEKRFVLWVYCEKLCRPLYRVLAVVGRKPVKVEMLMAQEGRHGEECCFMFQLRSRDRIFGHLVRQLEKQADIMDVQWQELAPREAPVYSGSPRRTTAAALAHYCLID